MLRNNIIHLFYLCFLIQNIVFLNPLNAQNIRIDELFTDWDDSISLISEPGDHSNFDFQELQITNDSTYLFLRIKLNQTINLQNSNSIKLAIDVDNNPNTGIKVYDLGAEFVYEFGNRRGILNNSKELFHNDIGLMSLPTVTSDQFEIAILRNIDNGSLVLDDTIQLHFYTSLNGGDVIPDSGTNYKFTFNNTAESTEQNYSLEKADENHLRLLSYNVLRDNIFESSKATAYQRILQFVDADILCFQEIYDHSAAQLISYLQGLNILKSNDTWYGIKDGNDLITLSKFPIIYHTEIQGNSVVEINIRDESFVIFNCHLPCCENDTGRVNEIDALLSFLHKSLEGESPLEIKNGTPYVILGDMNFVGHASQVNSLLTGDIIGNFIYGPDVRMDYGDGSLSDARPSTTGFPGSYTWYNDSSSFPSGRLDYLLFTDSVIEKTNAFVLDTKGLTNQQLNQFGLSRSDTQSASDHLPVVVDFKMESLSSINDIEENDIVIYPNPTNGIVNIKSNDTFDQLKLYDIQGRCVLEINQGLKSEYKLDLSHFAPQNFTLLLKFGDKQFSKSIILK